MKRAEPGQILVLGLALIGAWVALRFAVRDISTVALIVLGVCFTIAWTTRFLAWLSTPEYSDETTSGGCEYRSPRKISGAIANYSRWRCNYCGRRNEPAADICLTCGAPHDQE